MKALAILISTGLLVLAGSCGSDSTNNNAPADVTITIPSSATGLGSTAYGTNPLHVPMGTTVAWENSDSMTHTATSDTSIWDTNNISGGNTSDSVTFDTAGTFPYHCKIHGAVSMSGTIIVP